MAKRYIRKTKNYFIKKDMQGKFILAIFLLVFGACLIFAALLVFFTADSTTISYTNDNLEVSSTTWMLIKNVVVANWIFLIIGGTALILGAMVVTHRIAGPLVHFEKAIDAMADGDLSETIYLRKEDEGKDLAEKINHFNAVLSEKLDDISRCSDAIDDQLATFTSQAKPNVSSEEEIAICKIIKQHNEKLRAQLSYFTLRNE